MVQMAHMLGLTVGSLPVRGAWIEMRVARKMQLRQEKSLPVRGAWIEMSPPLLKSLISTSLPVRGAWIEIIAGTDGVYDITVAPRAGSVD